MFKWMDRNGAIETAIAEIKKGEDFRVVIECITGVQFESSDFCEYPELMSAKEYIDFMRDVAHAISDEMSHLTIETSL